MLILFQPWKSSSEEKEQKLFFFILGLYNQISLKGMKNQEGIYAKIQD